MKLHSDQLIMIVEDSDDDFEATERSLRKDGCLTTPLLRFETGEEALDYLLRRGSFAETPETPLPGVILLDLNLPGKGGEHFLREVKKAPELSKIPVVVVTTSDNPLDIERCYQAGANTYIQKPVDLERFFVAIRRLRDYWLDLAILPGAR
jgi:CheY-like chemotaxis protein